MTKRITVTLTEDQLNSTINKLYVFGLELEDKIMQGANVNHYKQQLAFNTRLINEFRKAKS